MDDIAALGASPIPGENPAGVEAKYEPEYAAVLAEIEKLGSATSGGGISWPVVAEQGRLVLARKSKDILIAAYLGVALQETEGVAGFRAAVELFNGLFTNFWETAFPPLARLRRRTNAFDWWHERAQKLLLAAGENAAPLPAAELDALGAALGELDRLSGDLMPEAQPLRDLRESVRRLPVLPEEKPAEAPPEQPAAPAAQAPPPPQQPQQAPPRAAAPAASPAVAPVAPAEDIAAARKIFIDAASQYAFFGHKADPKDPLPWQVLRLALWSKVAAAPPAENGQTMLPPPDMSGLAALNNMLNAGKALEAALGAEELFPAALFCLDLHRLVDEALGRLGADFAEARRRVGEECARFAARLPGVENLTFADGTPFASPETRQWLREAAASAADGAASTGKAPADPAAEVIAQAEALAQEQGAEAALRLLEEAQGPSRAANLALKAAQLKLLCRAKEKALAQALALALLDEVRDLGLEHSDSPRAVAALLAARDALTLCGDAEAAQAAQNRVARLQPSAALGWRRPHPNNP